MNWFFFPSFYRRIKLNKYILCVSVDRGREWKAVESYWIIVYLGRIHLYKLIWRRRRRRKKLLYCYTHTQTQLGSFPFAQLNNSFIDIHVVESLPNKKISKFLLFFFSLLPRETKKANVIKIKRKINWMETKRGDGFARFNIHLNFMHYPKLLCWIT